MSELGAGADEPVCRDKRERVSRVTRGPAELDADVGVHGIGASGGLGAHGRPLDDHARRHRITSYNVCYTKLLRRYGPYIERDADGETQRASVPEDMAPDELTVAKAEELFANVITSYSIHYTKLYEIQALREALADTGIELRDVGWYPAR